MRWPEMINRRALVERHAPVLDGIVADSPLSIGNGELCFTVDCTGVQSLPSQYPLADPAGGPAGTLLGTQSQWGWHTIPWPRGEVPSPTRRPYWVGRGEVDYVDFAGPFEPEAGRSPSGDQWLRANPHRLDLGRVGLVVGEREASVVSGEDWPELDVARLSEARQRLDLWTAQLDSEFRLDGLPVHVRTSCHPKRDVIAIRIRSEALIAGLRLAIGFSYGSASWNQSADWSSPRRHSSELVSVRSGWVVRRTLDETAYAVRISAGPGARLATQAHPHLFFVDVDRPQLDVVMEFALGTGGAEMPPRGVSEVEECSARHWAGFWQRGAAVELADSADPRAVELERRVVLSQYLTAINCAGSLPPQETGLMVNSWYGRFHLEMHWWHAAHFALWGRADLLERSMGWYQDRLQVARDLACSQGYEGARWPKQVGPDGREGPSPISPFLIWQQPHPLYLLELLWRQARSRELLERYAPVVLETATFMADFAEPTVRGYDLGPPVVPAQECYSPDRGTVRNPTFELAYWRFGLEIAVRWRRRLGLSRAPKWEAVAEGLAPPTIRHGTYAAIGGPPYLVRQDHPSMLMALGFLPAGASVDPRVMGATFDDVRRDWDWESAWGWDFPAMAMTAARLGRPDDALEALMTDSVKNRYLPNGHNPQSRFLPAYLPANGALLAAVAMMAGGWDAAPRSQPGFPLTGAWDVRQEGFPGAC